MTWRATSARLYLELAVAVDCNVCRRPGDVGVGGGGGGAVGGRRALARRRAVGGSGGRHEVAHWTLGAPGARCWGRQRECDAGVSVRCG